MPNRSISIALAATLVASSVLAGDKLTKDDKKWLELVTPIILPEEERIYRDLKKGERKTFEEIFWARRNPDPEKVSEENSFKDDYLAARKAADASYRVLGKAGGVTDCGRTFLLLGEPDEVQKGSFGADIGARPPETWTYRGEMFKDGEIVIDFDETCSVPDGVQWSAQLKRLTETKITLPQLGYHRKDEKLIKLADQLPKPSPALTLLEAPRQDFALEAEPKLSMRSMDGGATYLAGLVRGDAAGFETSERDGRRVADLTLALEVIDAEGRSVMRGAKELETPVGDDGKFTASYGVALRPGEYTLKVGALNAKSEAGSVIETPIESRDFGGHELMVSDILVFSEMEQRQEVDQKDPLAAFLLGTNQVIPRYGNEFEQNEAIQIISMVYGAAADEVSGQPSLGATFTILKDGRPISRSQEAEYTTPDSVPAVGPIPLASFEPGEYSVELSLEDKVSGGEHVRRATFTVKWSVGFLDIRMGQAR